MAEDSRPRSITQPKFSEVEQEKITKLAKLSKTDFDDAYRAEKLKSDGSDDPQYLTEAIDRRKKIKSAAQGEIRTLDNKLYKHEREYSEAFEKLKQETEKNLSDASVPSKDIVDLKTHLKDLQETIDDENKNLTRTQKEMAKLFGFKLERSPTYKAPAPKPDDFVEVSYSDAISTHTKEALSKAQGEKLKEEASNVTQELETAKAFKAKTTTLDNTAPLDVKLYKAIREDTERRVTAAEEKAAKVTSSLKAYYSAFPGPTIPTPHKTQDENGVPFSHTSLRRFNSIGDSAKLEAISKVDNKEYEASTLKSLDEAQKRLERVQKQYDDSKTPTAFFEAQNALPKLNYDVLALKDDLKNFDDRRYAMSELYPYSKQSIAHYERLADEIKIGKTPEMTKLLTRRHSMEEMQLTGRPLSVEKKEAIRTKVDEQLQGGDSKLKEAALETIHTHNVNYQALMGARKDLNRLYGFYTPESAESESQKVPKTTEEIYDAQLKHLKNKHLKSNEGRLSDRDEVNLRESARKKTQVLETKLAANLRLETALGPIEKLGVHNFRADQQDERRAAAVKLYKVKDDIDKSIQEINGYMKEPPSEVKSTERSNWHKLYYGKERKLPDPTTMADSLTKKDDVPQNPVPRVPLGHGTGQVAAPHRGASL